MKTYLVRGIKTYHVELLVEADSEEDAQKEFMNTLADGFDEFEEMDFNIEEIEEVEDTDPELDE